MFRSATAAIPQEKSWVQNFLAVVGASLLIALTARISIPLPFTPVALSLAPHVCLFLGALLGARRGALAVMLYLLQGVAGFPVFALGKAGGLAYLMGPTGGYLIGYAAGAYLTGFLVEKMEDRSSIKILGAMTLGNLALYAFGVAQLSLFLGIPKAILCGVVPFLFGDALKLVFATWGTNRITSTAS